MSIYIHWNGCRERLENVTGADSDHTVAYLIAEYLLAERGHRGNFYPSVITNNPGSFPLPYTHKYKNCFAYSSKDKATAAGWIIAAALAGYSVMSGYVLRGSTGGPGTIAEIRKRAKERK